MSVPRKKVAKHTHTDKDVQDAAEYSQERTRLGTIPASQVLVEGMADEYINLSDWLYGFRLVNQMVFDWTSLSGFQVDLDGGSYAHRAGMLFLVAYTDATGLTIRNKAAFLDWSLDPQISVQARFPTSAYQTSWMIAGEPDAAKHFGFKVYGGSLYLTVGNGSEEHVEPIIADLAPHITNSFSFRAKLWSGVRLEVEVWEWNGSEWITKYQASIEVPSWLPSTGKGYPCYIKHYVSGANAFKYLNIGRWITGQKSFQGTE